MVDEKHVARIVSVTCTGTFLTVPEPRQDHDQYCYDVCKDKGLTLFRQAFPLKNKDFHTQGFGRTSPERDASGGLTTGSSVPARANPLPSRVIYKSISGLDRFGNTVPELRAILGGQNKHGLRSSSVMATASSSFLSVSALAAVRGETRLFSDLSFELHPGQVLFIQGGNGCGKTSLLYILAGLRLPESGTVCWGGNNIEHLGKQYHSQLCFVGHTNGVKADLTVLENILGFQALKSNKGEAIQSTIDTLGLAGYEDNLAYQLSSGQQRRLALSRLLFSQQPLWILDEPFTSLDKASIRLFESLVVAHSQRGGMVIITSHQPLDLSGGVAVHLLLEKAA